MTLKIILKGGPGSGNFGHAGRPGQRGGSSAGTGGVITDANIGIRINELRPRLVDVAQKVYDEWDDDEFGCGGGICDIIAEEMAGVLEGEGIDTLPGGQEGSDHAYTIAYTDAKAFEVDIPPDVYESGGGFNWEKVEGITIRPSDVIVQEINRGDIFVEGF